MTRDRPEIDPRSTQDRHEIDQRSTREGPSGGQIDSTRPQSPLSGGPLPPHPECPPRARVTDGEAGEGGGVDARSAVPVARYQEERHASSRKALQMAARAATVRAARRSTCLAMLRTRAVKAAACRRDAEEDGARGRLKEFDASTRITHACTEAAALPTSQMKHCVQMMCCAPQAEKICTRKVKVVPK